MTSTTAPEASIAAPPASRAEARYHLSFPRLVRSEWIKFTTVRSTWWSFGLVAVVSVGLSLLQAAAMSGFAQEAPAGSVAEANATAVMVIVFATVMTQLLAVIIGTITVTGEYSTGMVRSTLTADPGRIGALLAKVLVVAGTMFVFSLVVFAAAALVTGPLLSAGLELSDPESSIKPLLGAALYLALVSAMGVGIGFVIRNGPGALAVGIGLIFVAPVLVLFFPRSDDFAWVHDLAGYLPSNAGQSLFMQMPMSGVVLESWPALIAIIAWAVAAVAGGAAVLKARDA